MVLDLANGVEGRVPVEDVLGAVGRVVPAKGALPIDEADDQVPARSQHPAGFLERRIEIIDEADRGHHQDDVEGGIAVGECLGDAIDGVDPTCPGEGPHPG